MRHIVFLSLWLSAYSLYAVLNADASEALAVSISIPAQGAIGTGHDSRRLSFRGPQERFHVLISNDSTNDMRLWKDDCSWGYEALSFQISDAAGNHWTAKKQPREWRSNYPRWWLLKPKETLIVDVYFTDTKSWDGFRRPAKDSALKLNLTAIFEILADERTQEHQIWNGKIVSAPLEVTFYN